MILNGILILASIVQAYLYIILYNEIENYVDKYTGQIDDLKGIIILGSTIGILGLFTERWIIYLSYLIILFVFPSHSLKWINIKVYILIFLLLLGNLLYIGEL